MEKFMLKQKTKKLFLLILIFTMIFYVFISIIPIKSISEIVALTDEDDPIRTICQKGSFIYNHRAYVFYVNNNTLVYEHRSNLTDWSNEIEIRTPCESGDRFSVWLEESNNSGYIHYVTTEYDDDIYYRRGLLENSGIISWTTTEQTIWWTSSSHTMYPFIAVDSEGYQAIISTYYYDGAGENHWKTMVKLSSRNDGIFQTMETKSFDETYTTSSDEVQRGLQIIPQMNRTFWFLYSADPTYKANYGRRWNGTAWTDYVTNPIQGLNTDYDQYNAVSETNSNTLHLMYNRGVSGVSTFCHRIWNGSWYDIVGNSLPNTHYNWTSAIKPVSILNSSDNSITCLWEEYPDNDKIYSMSWNSSAWSQPSVFCDESHTIIEPEDFNSIYSSDRYIGVTYLTSGSSNVTFAFSPYLYALQTQFQITNMEGCGNWLWTDKIYSFEVQVAEEPYIITVNFHDEGNNWMNCTYDYQNETLSYDVDNDIATVHSLDVGTGTTYNYSITFNIMLTQNILDSLNVNIDIFVNNTNGDEYSGTEIDYVNIYNIGGHAEYSFSGTGQRVVGGDVLELQVGSGTGIAQANMTFRQLQHFHFYFRWKGESGWDDYCDTEEANIDLVEYGIYICYNDTWIKEWNFVIDIIPDSKVNEPLGWNYALINVSWYRREIFFKNDILSVVHEGENTDHDWMSFFVDFWFNKINASTVFGGRIITEMYGMASSVPAWLGGGTWNPYYTNVSQSMFFEDIQDNDGNIISSREITLMKVYCKITGSSGLNQIMSVGDYDLSTIKVASAKMEGIDTPIFVTTKEPDLPKTGFLAPLVDVVANIGTMVAVALGSMAFMIASGLDNVIYTLTGNQQVFTNTIYTLSLWGGQIGTLAMWMVESIPQFIGLLSSIVIAISGLLTGFFNLISITISGIYQSLVGISSFFVYLADLWNGTGIFEGSVPLSTYWMLFSIAFLVFMAMGTIEFGWGWLIGWVLTGIGILRAIAWAIMFGFNLLRKIIGMIFDIIPF